MKKEGKKIINNAKKKKKYSILVTFDIAKKNKSIVLYTDYSKDPNNNVKIYSSIYDAKGKLEPILDKDEIDIVNEYIKKLENDLKSGIKLG